MMTTSDQPMDHVPPEAESSGETDRSDLEKNVTARSTWIRLIFMVATVILYTISRMVTVAVVVVQFFNVLITGTTNGQLKTFGHSLAIYSYQAVDYLTFNTESKPFPLGEDWPAGNVAADAGAESAEEDS